MRQRAIDIFKKKYKEASGKDPDNTIMKNMEYAIEAMIEFHNETMKILKEASEWGKLNS